jgi:hypothetical protein
MIDLEKKMKPIDFVVFKGDSSPNTPVYQVAEAMNADIVIHGPSGKYEVLSYFFDQGKMVLEIQPQTSQSPTVLDLDMSVRTTNLLLHHKIDTVVKVLEWGSKRILRLPHFGRRHLQELTEVLEAHGYVLYEGGSLPGADNDNKSKS